MNSSARNELSDADIIVNNIPALEQRLKESWAIVDKQEQKIFELKAQVDILRKVIKEFHHDC